MFWGETSLPKQDQNASHPQVLSTGVSEGSLGLPAVFGLSGATPGPSNAHVRGGKRGARCSVESLCDASGRRVPPGRQQPPPSSHAAHRKLLHHLGSSWAHAINLLTCACQPGVIQSATTPAAPHPALLLLVGDHAAWWAGPGQDLHCWQPGTGAREGTFKQRTKGRA